MKCPTRYIAILLFVLWTSCADGFAPPRKRSSIAHLSSKDAPRHRIAPVSLQVVEPSVVEASFVFHESSMFEESFVESVVTLPAVWSAAIMVTLVGLMETWEKAVHFAHEITPPPVRAVLDDLIGEISNLGFIGLVLTFLLSNLALGETVGEVSKHYLGNEEALLENLHFWHQTFFQAAVTFCFSAAVMVLQVIRTVKEVSDLAEEQIRKHRDRPDSDELAMEEYESLLKLQHSDETESIFRHELTLTQEERGAEALIIRARLEREFNLPRDFRIEQAIEYSLSGGNVNFFKIKPT